MKGLKVILVILGTALLAAGVSTTSYAFHAGGVAECVGCHSMHSPPAGGVKLLIGTDQSSTCLSCHEHAGDTGPSSYHVSTASSDLPAGTPPKQLTPGGDFGWLRKSFTFVVRSSTIVEDGAEFGHNIVAVDKGYFGVTGNSPGGSFDAAQLACNSCHDPHGKYRRDSAGAVATTGAPIVGSGSATGAAPPAGQAYGSYRLLAGAGYAKAAYTGVPMAIAPSSYNRSEGLTQTRVAYGQGTAAGYESWGSWCATCHATMHGAAGTTHPVDTTLSSGVVDNYGKYVSSGNMGGTPSSSYLSLVPFAEGTNTLATLAGHAKTDDSALGAPSTSDRVMCLSCHRAHASGFPFMLRWQSEGTYLTVYTAGAAHWPGTDIGSNTEYARGRTEAENMKGYYDRPASKFGTMGFQRALCNKCHAND
jgi:predicted CXXCH cytochrome family protein